MFISIQKKCPCCSSNTTADLSILPDNSCYISLVCNKDASHSYLFKLEDLDFDDVLTKLENNREKDISIYWAFVDTIKWEENYKEDNNYFEYVRENIIPNTKQIDIIKFHYNNLYKNLMYVLDKYVQEEKDYVYPLRNDSTNDFIAHICSLGKEKYFYYFNNPAEMYKKAKEECYCSESFDYIWNEI